MTIIHNAQVTLFCLAVCGVFVVIGCIVVELVVGVTVVVGAIVVEGGKVVVVGAKVVVIGAEVVVSFENAYVVINVVVGTKVVVSSIIGSSRIPSSWRKIIIIGFSALYLLTKQTS